MLANRAWYHEYKDMLFVNITSTLILWCAARCIVYLLFLLTGNVDLCKSGHWLIDIRGQGMRYPVVSKTDEILTCAYMPFFMQGILLVYDITNKWSFDGIDRWIKEVNEVFIVYTVRFLLCLWYTMHFSTRQVNE